GGAGRGELADQFAGRGVVYEDRLRLVHVVRAAPGDQVLAVVREGHGLTGVGVPGEAERVVARFRRPQEHGVAAILERHGQLLTVRRERVPAVVLLRTRGLRDEPRPVAGVDLDVSGGRVEGE